MLATDAPMPPEGPRVRLAYLDALRGLAILGVLIVHFSLWLKPAGEAEKGLMGNGAFGVQLFYVVSAFTICMSLAADRGPGALQRFFTRRFFRIAPMFWVAIILSLTLQGLLPRYAAPDGIAPWAVVATFLMAHGLHPESINSVVFGGWSVGVEVMFYVLAPMLFLRIATIERAVLALLISAIGAWVAMRIGRLAMGGWYPDNAVDFMWCDTAVMTRKILQ